MSSRRSRLLRCGLALNVHDPRPRVHHDLPARGPELQAEIDVLVVGRLPLETESTDVEKVRPPHEQAGGRTEVDDARSVVVLRTPDAALADLDDVAGRKGEAADLLDPAVGVEEHRADGGHCRVVRHRGGQLVDPARFDEGVIVEEDDEVAGGEIDSDVVALAEVPVLAHLDQQEVIGPLVLAKDGHLFVIRAVVDDDDLADEGTLGATQRLETLERRLGVVVVQDDDRHVVVEGRRPTTAYLRRGHGASATENRRNGAVTLHELDRRRSSTTLSADAAKPA